MGACHLASMAESSPPPPSTRLPARMPTVPEGGWKYGPDFPTGQGLRHQEEEAIRRRLHKLSKVECKDAITTFANCTEGRLISTVWACRQQSQAMNDCLRSVRMDPKHQQTVMDKYMEEKTEFTANIDQVSFLGAIANSRK